MTLVRLSLRRVAACLPPSQHHAGRAAFHTTNTQNSLPVIPTCPAPTCECSEIPAGLDIDQSTDMTSSVAPYAEHLIIPSGQADWASRIEDDKSSAPWAELVTNIKHELGRKGRFHDPYHNVIISAASFEPPQDHDKTHTARALLFPSFRYIANVSSRQDQTSDFIRSFLLPEKLHPAHKQQGDEIQYNVRDVSKLASTPWASNVRPISSPTVLICSHNSRDSRCGILGPLLHAEFTQYINKRQTLRSESDELTSGSHSHAPTRSYASHPEFHPDLVSRDSGDLHPINIGMISHIGGHKFAGNVIIYIPPDHQCRPIQRVARGTKPKDRLLNDSSSSIVATDDSSSIDAHEGDDSHSQADSTSPLAGKGIWYGRVEPKHIEGIVEQTIGHGRIIKELFRGGINQDGSPIRLPLY